VEEKRGQLVKRVEHERVPPDDDGDANWTHGEHVIGLEPQEVVWVEGGLDDYAQVDEVAKVDHVELGLDE